MQFINIVNGTELDNTSRWLIRKQAARFIFNADSKSASFSNPPKQQSSTSRFRLKQKIIQSRSIQKVPAVRTKQFEEHDARPSQDESIPRKSDLRVIGQHGRNEFGEVPFTYVPSQGSWDPFNALALQITKRDQTLMHFYFNERGQKSSPMMPYCKAFFGVAIHDEACFHAVLSHYSATYRRQHWMESIGESIQHLMAAIKIITKRLEDPYLRYGNGTIGAVSCLVIYESANGVLPNLEYHMNGMHEMIRRRGGFEGGKFPPDLSRLIRWTDLSTAKYLWRPLKFPAIKSNNYPATELYPRKTSLAAPEMYSEQSIDVVLAELKIFINSLPQGNGTWVQAPSHTISKSDTISDFERKFVSLIHGQAGKHHALDKACSIAALVNIQIFIGKLSCTSRIIDTGRLKRALEDVGDDLFAVLDHETRWMKLLWSLTLGAVRSSGNDQDWFVRALKVLCDRLRFETWLQMRGALEEVLWLEDLDQEGMLVWDRIAGIES